TAVEQELNGSSEGATGGEHRVKHEALASGEVIGQALCVGFGDECLFVALHPEKADLGRRHELHHSVEHAESSTQDWHDERRWFADAHTGGCRDGGFDIDGFNANVAGRLVGE